MTDVPEEYATPQEETLSRLFSCMNDEEQHKLLKIALQMLGRRCSFDPHYRRRSAESLKAELRNRALNDRLAGTWPGGWEGRSLVDLDNMGDAGAWLDNSLGEPISEVLFGWAWDDDAVADSLADSFIEGLAEHDCELPSDFLTGDDGAEEFDYVAAVQPEFVAFLEAWREGILKAIEKQNLPESGSGGKEPA